MVHHPRLFALGRLIFIGSRWIALISAFFSVIGVVVTDQYRRADLFALALFANDAYQVAAGELKLILVT